MNQCMLSKNKNMSNGFGGSKLTNNDRPAPGNRTNRKRQRTALGILTLSVLATCLLVAPQGWAWDFGGVVWFDTSGCDGIRGGGEPGVPYVIVEVHKCSDNSLVSSKVTTSDGSFDFTDVDVPLGGTYRVCFSNLPPGFTFGPQTYPPPAAPAVVSTVDPTTGCAPCFTFTDPTNLTLNNASLCQLPGPPSLCTPMSSCIGTNFNGTAIAQGDFLWLSSVVNVTGRSSKPATIVFNNLIVYFVANGSPVVLNVPPAVITFDKTATTATTTFNVKLGIWETTVPVNYSGNVFLSGLAYQLPKSWPGGIGPVEWCGDFSADTAGLSVQWQWAAAVYTNFSWDLNALAVKPTDGNSCGQWTHVDCGNPAYQCTGAAQLCGRTCWRTTWGCRLQIPFPYVCPSTKRQFTQWNWCQDTAPDHWSGQPNCPTRQSFDHHDHSDYDYSDYDHAGTPENFKYSVIGGARGNGGCNFTGTYSGPAGGPLCP